MIISHNQSLICTASVTIAKKNSRSNRQYFRVHRMLG